jgi:chaperonin GroES
MADEYEVDDLYEDDPEQTEEQPLAWEQIEDLATGENVTEIILGDHRGEKLIDGLKSCMLDGFRLDKASRTDWEQSARDGLKLIAAKGGKKTFPFDGASNVKFPTLQDAVVQFWARAITALIQDDRVVKAKIVGPDPEGAKRKRAERVSEHLSYQAIEISKSWRSDMSALLMQYPAVGHAFKKVYWARDSKNPEGDFCSALDVYVNQGARSLERCPRITYRYPLYPYEIEEKMRDGRFRRVDLGDADELKQEPRHQLEATLRYDMDGDGLAEPWIVTIDEKSEQVVQVLANFAPEDIQREMMNVPMPVFDPATMQPVADPMTGQPMTQMQEMPLGDVLRVEEQKYWVDYKFLDDPDGGYYGIGLAKLLENLQSAIDTAINQLIDAATLQNAGGGFVGRGVNLNERGGEIRMRPGLWQTLNAPGAVIRDAMVPHEHAGPSQALFNVLGLLIDTSKTTAMVLDVLTGEAPSQQPATTTIALIEQGLQVFGAIFINLWRGQQEEYRIRMRLNALYLDDEAYRAVVDDPTASAKADYSHADCDVVPVADPRQVTSMQKMARAQFLREHIGMPGINNEEIYRRTFEAAGIEEPDALLAPPDPMQIEAMKLEMAKLASEIAKNMAEALAKKAGAVKSIADAESAEAGANIAEYTQVLQMIATLFAATNPGMMNGQAAGPAQAGGLAALVGQPNGAMAPGGPSGLRGGEAGGALGAGGIPGQGGNPGRGNGAYGGAGVPDGGSSGGGPAF